MSDIAIKVEDLGKLYRLGEVGTGTISHDLNRWVAKLRGKEDPFSKIGEINDRTAKGDSDYVWALKDLNFEVKKGEVLGIIGRNGAGKSTLLKLLSKVTQPSTGRIKVNGRIASLLEVGTGFHPEMTGRENIFLNGAIMGMTKREIKAKFDEIVDFAGVERYIDTPVKRYSSGMYVRLAFAVAAHLEPEILIVDEVLAVGDAEFQKKCLGKMKDVSVNDGRTVLFVSHQMGAVQALCNSGLFLKNGSVHLNDEIKNVINEYVNDEKDSSSYIHDVTVYQFKKSAHFMPLEFGIVDDAGTPINGYLSNDSVVNVKVVFNVDEVHEKMTFGIAVYTIQSELMFLSMNRDLEEHNWPSIKKGKNEVIIKMPRNLLNEGDYKIELLSSIHFMYWILPPESSPKVNLKLRGGLSNSDFWIERRPGYLAPQLKFVSCFDH